MQDRLIGSARHAIIKRIIICDARDEKKNVDRYIKMTSINTHASSLAPRPNFDGIKNLRLRYFSQ